MAYEVRGRDGTFAVSQRAVCVCWNSRLSSALNSPNIVIRTEDIGMSFAAAADCARSLSPVSSPDDKYDWHTLFSGQEIGARDERRWWVFYTKSRQEKALSQYLLSRHVPHYLPLHEKHTFSRGRRLTSFVPLFSGYVFLFADWEERISALESNRVARIIAAPEWQHARLVCDLLQIRRLIQSGVPLTPESRIQPGERVRVKSGHLAGLEGIVLKRRGGSRLLVAVDYLQQGASIEVHDFALEIV